MLSAHAQTCLGVHRAELIILSGGRRLNGGWTVIVRRKKNRVFSTGKVYIFECD